MATYYAVKKNDKGGVDVAARHPAAKQVLWGWGGDYGSTKDRGAIELYGREASVGENWRGDHTGWVWSLSADGVASILRGLRAQIADPKRYEVSKTEQTAAKELRRKIEALVG